MKLPRISAGLGMLRAGARGRFAAGGLRQREEDFQQTLDFLEEHRDLINLVSTGFGMEVGPNMPISVHPERFDLRVDATGQPVMDQFGRELCIRGLFRAASASGGATPQPAG